MVTEERSDVPLTHRLELIPGGKNEQLDDTTVSKYASSEDLADQWDNQYKAKVEKERLPPGYYIREGSLYFTKDSSNEETAICIGDELLVIAVVSNENGGGQARVVQFHERSRNIDKTVTISIEAMYREINEPLALLASEGYYFLPDRGVKTLLAGYITKMVPSKTLYSVSRCGWLSDHVFVLPNMVVSGAGAQDVHYTGSVQPGIFSQKGTLQAWRDRIALPTYSHPSLLFAICAAFAAPLLRVLKIPGGGFHLHGASGTGKTTALKVAASVIGSEGYITTWRATSNGLEATSEAYNDLLLPLDEIHQIDPQEIPENVYLIANGRGR